MIYSKTSFSQMLAVLVRSLCAVPSPLKTVLPGFRPSATEVEIYLMVTSLGYDTASFKPNQLVKSLNLFNLQLNQLPDKITQLTNQEVFSGIDSFQLVSQLKTYDPKSVHSLPVYH